MSLSLHEMNIQSWKQDVGEWQREKLFPFLEWIWDFFLLILNEKLLSVKQPPQ